MTDYDARREYQKFIGDIYERRRKRGYCPDCVIGEHPKEGSGVEECACPAGYCGCSSIPAQTPPTTSPRPRSRR